MSRQRVRVQVLDQQAAWRLAGMHDAIEAAPAGRLRALVARMRGEEPAPRNGKEPTPCPA